MTQNCTSVLSATSLVQNCQNNSCQKLLHSAAIQIYISGRLERDSILERALLTAGCKVFSVTTERWQGLATFHFRLKRSAALRKFRNRGVLAVHLFLFLWKIDSRLIKTGCTNRWSFLFCNKNVPLAFANKDTWALRKLSWRTHQKSYVTTDFKAEVHSVCAQNI